MAHHVEPMDIDGESDFDNKENTYHHSNVLSRTPCTEKGYEELDVSELNMKLRYSITPVASPMSKSMSHCVDNRYNASTDESLNNTVINENNLTRSLNSTLNKTDVSIKTLPLQALPSDHIDNRNSNVLRALEITDKDVTITVNTGNELDCLSTPSSSSSMAHTPEATTPTKEIPKNDGGSPIMRGLKSVLSMFRTSQSPIPPSEVDDNGNDHISVDVAPLDPKLQAVSSTPINQKSKEQSMSRRSSPYKESIVFNEDLEKELQWNDDSTIVFSTEKIPIHKLFFQDKPGSKTDEFCVKKEEAVANMSVEYMDVSYNDISVKDKTLNTTVNKTNINDVSESDGEFVDCETTFTQEESKPMKDEGKINNNVSIKQDDPESNVIKKEVMENLVVDTTQDIIKLIDSTQFTGQEIESEKQLDYSSADIVNRLSDLINASENETNVANIDVPESKINKKFKKVEAAVCPDSHGNPVIDVENEVNINDITTVENDANVSLPKGGKLQSVIVVPDILDSHRESSLIEPVPLGVQSLVTDEVPLQLPKLDEIKLDVTEMYNEKEAITVSPMDIPLPIEDNLDEINDNSVRFSPSNELQDKTITSDETSNIVPMRSLENTTYTTIESTSEKQISHTEDASCEIPCLPKVLSSDDSLLKIDNVNFANINTLSYEAITDASDPVLLRIETNVSDINNDFLPTTNQTPDIISTVDDSLKTESIVPNGDTANSSIVDNNPALVKRVTEMEVSFIGKNKEQIQDASAMDVSIICEPSPVASVNIKEDHSSSLVEEIHDKIATAVNAGLSSNQIDKKCNDKEHSMALPVTITDEELMSQNESETLKEVNTATAEKLDTVGFDDSKIPVTALDNQSSDSNGTIIVSSVIADAEKSNAISNINTSCEIISDTINTLNVATTSRNSINEMLNEQCTNALIVPELEVTNTTEASSNVSQENENITDTPNTLDGIEKPKQPDEKIDDEIVLSEGNSPFVSMSAEELDPKVKQSDFEEVGKENAVIEEIYVPPSSPKIVSKGYNLNFDDLDSMDPFATKTKIRMSPPPAISPNTPIHTSKNTNNNRRKTMPAKKNVSKAKKSFNSTFDSAESDPSKVIKKSIVEGTDNNKNINANIYKPDSFILGNENQSNVAPLSVHSGTVDAVNKIKAERKPNIASNLNKTTSMENCNIVGATQPDVTDENKTDCNKNNNLDFNDVVDAIMDLDKSHLTLMESEPGNDACTELKNIVEASESDVKDQKADSNQNTNAVLNDIVAITDQSIIENKHMESDSNKDVTLDVKDIVSRPFKTSTMIDDIAMSDNWKTDMKSDNASSSEQSTYYSAGASSTEFGAKNVFNLPEIDDKDFNPFATKSKICQTPPPDLDIVDPFATKCNMKSSPEATLAPQKDANATVIMDNYSTKETLYDVSTCSSASDDKDVTVQEVHTEDEDTIEGPFLEADDVHECEKMSNFIADEDKGNIGDFDNRNELATDDNEMFIDAEAFEFLMNQNKADEVACSGKESLFLKFDPLFARRLTSDGVASALSELKRRQTTPKRAPKEKELISFDRPSAGPSELKITCQAQTPVEYQDDINVAMSKPMMVVPPAVNPVVSPKKCVTPSRANRLSMTFTSPAMAVIDRLLSLSSSSPSAGLDTTVTHVGREHNEADQALTQLRELLAEKEINVYNLRCESKELKDRLSTLETQMKSLEAESEERLKKINELTENLTDKTKMNKNMAKVVEEYERTIASLISETEQDKKRYAEERDQLIRERDEQSTHLASMEVSFSDLHSKYEKSKQVIMGYKSNEDAYKNSLKEFEENLSKMHTNYELLKQHATSKLNHANQELEKLNKAHEAEVLKLNAMIKRKDLHITSLEESLAQKIKANEELTAICDELINKVG